MVLLFGMVRVNAVGDDNDDKKPAAAPTKKPSAMPRSNRNRAMVASPAAPPVEAPALPALPTNSDGVAAAAARPPPKTSSIKPAKFEVRWWSHTKPSFCEEKPKSPPLLPPEGVDPRFLDCWDRFHGRCVYLSRTGKQ